MLDKRSLCFTPFSPSPPPPLLPCWPCLLLSRDHKAELSPALGWWEGPCGQEPCRQMSADDKHTGYLQQMRACRSKANTHAVIRFVCCCRCCSRAKDVTRPQFPRILPRALAMALSRPQMKCVMDYRVKKHRA